MKSKSERVATMRAEEDVRNPSAEAQEEYDEFNSKTVVSTMPMVIARSANKSPLSDEGIEPDTERKRGSVSRCWSIDSAVTSEEDYGQSVRRQKLRVTRCCSSDSAVLSDDDQNKGELIFRPNSQLDEFRFCECRVNIVEIITGRKARARLPKPVTFILLMLYKINKLLVCGTSKASSVRVTNFHFILTLFYHVKISKQICLFID
jgi:hypothetical protein